VPVVRVGTSEVGMVVQLPPAATDVSDAWLAGYGGASMRLVPRSYLMKLDLASDGRIRLRTVAGGLDAWLEAFDSEPCYSTERRTRRAP
jgi:hypothetical protein